MPLTAVIPTRPFDSPAPTAPAAPGESWHEAAWTTVSGWFDTVPSWLWASLAITLGLATLLTFPMLRAQAFKAGQRTTKTELTDADRQDRRLLIAALIPATLFWVAVLVGSGRGLTAFGRDDLKWTGGWELLVPFTLDGVAIAFALLAFRAVKKGLNPDRATHIAWAAMLASAGLNFFHEVGGSSLGAVYLAILSVLGMLIFHEFLAQFEEGADYVARQNPKFGLRWFTWPTNTVCAWFAWRNHPPEVVDGVRVTVRLAVQHLEQVRADKTRRRAEQVDAPAWWMRLAPWAHIGALRTALTAERITAAANLETVQSTVAELTDRLDRHATDRDTEQRSASTAVQNLRAELAALRTQHQRDMEQLVTDYDRQLRSQSEQHRSELAEQAAALRAEHAEQFERFQAEQAGKVLRFGRDNGRSAPATSKKAPERKTVLSDIEALAAMFAEHPEPDFAWSDREVNRITGAGFSSRAPRLTGAAIKHQQDCPEQSHKACFTERSGARSDDAEERAS